MRPVPSNEIGRALMSDIIPLKVGYSAAPMASDLELMQRISTGDPSALEQLLRRYWHPLVRYGASLLRSVDAAEDIVQETFVRVWERRSDWRPGGSVPAFLYQITRNLALNERRRRRVRVRWLERVRGEDRAPSPPPTELLEVEERRELVQQAIQALPERRREVFILAWFHRLSYHQIAEILGVSRNTVSNHMTAANADLRRRLGAVWKDNS